MPQQGNQFVVSGGDNLFSIAEKVYNDQRMFAEIMRLNKLSSGVIRPGMVLTLPRQKPSSQIVINRDTMNYLKTENKILQDTGRVPTTQEVQLSTQQGTFGAPGQPTFGDAGYGLIKTGPNRSEQQIRMNDMAQRGYTYGTQRPPYISTSDILREQTVPGSQLKNQPAPISREEYLAGIVNPMRREVNPEAQKQILNKAGDMLGATAYGFLAGSAVGAPFAGPGGLIGAGVGLAGSLLYDPMAKAWKNYMGQMVDPNTGRPIQKTAPTTAPLTAPPVTAKPFVPKPPTVDTSEYFVSSYGKTYNNANPPITQNTIAQLDTMYANGDIFPENVEFYGNFINLLANATGNSLVGLEQQKIPAQAVEQFIYTFNVNDRQTIDFLNSLTDPETIIQSTSEEELIGSLYESLNELPYWYDVSPMNVYNSGGFGGGNAKSIGTGGGVSWSGL